MSLGFKMERKNEKYLGMFERVGNADVMGAFHMCSSGMEMSHRGMYG